MIDGLSAAYSDPVPDMGTSPPASSGLDHVVNGIAMGVLEGAALAAAAPEAVGAAAAVGVAYGVIGLAAAIAEVGYGLVESLSPSATSGDQSQATAAINIAKAPYETLVQLALQSIEGEEQARNDVRTAKALNDVLDLIDPQSSTADKIKAVQDLIELAGDRPSPGVSDSGSVGQESHPDTSGVSDGKVDDNPKESSDD